MKKHRVAVVGCGALARIAHLPSCRDNDRIELVATCDIDRDTAEACRKEFGAERSETDWRRVIEADDIDFCILATHTNLRGKFIIPALEAGKPVYTEKPLAPELSEMRDILNASRQTGVPVCVGHNRRSSPAMFEFRRLLEKARSVSSSSIPTVDRSGQRGAVPEESTMQMLIRVNDDSRSWKHWIFEDEEGIMHAEMVHFVDIALWLNNSYPVRVFAEGSPRGNFTIIIRFADGSQATIQHTMVGNFDYPKELFEATVNFVTIAMDQHFEIRQVGMEDEYTQKAFPYAKGCEWAREQGLAGYMRELTAEKAAAKREKRSVRWLNVNKGHYGQVDRFLDCIEGKGQTPCDIASAVAVNRVVLKILQSVRLGLPVSVTPEDWHIPELSA